MIVLPRKPAEDFFYWRKTFKHSPEKFGNPIKKAIVRAPLKYMPRTASEPSGVIQTNSTLGCEKQSDLGMDFLSVVCYYIIITALLNNF